MTKRYYGLHGSARGWLLSELSSRPMLVVCKDTSTAEEIYRDLKFFIGDSVFEFPAWDVLPFEPLSPQPDIIAKRIFSLMSLRGNSRSVIVSTVDALLRKVVSKRNLINFAREFKKGEAIEKEDIESLLELFGFSKVSLVEEVGEFAARGSVIDLYPIEYLPPIRIEFTGGIIQELRYFDPESQRTTDDISSFTLHPVSEFIYSDKSIAESISKLKLRGKELETPAREIARAMGAFRSKIRYPGIESLLPYLNQDLASPFSFLPSEAHIAIVDELGVKNGLDEFSELLSERELRFTSEHYLVPPKEDLFISSEDFLKEVRSREVTYLNQVHILDESKDDGRPINVVSLSHTELQVRLKTGVGTGAALKPLRQAVTRWRKGGSHIAFVVGSLQRCERLAKYLLEIGVDAKILGSSGHDWVHSPHRYPVVILHGQIAQGFELPKENLVFVNESEIFSDRSYKRSTRSKVSLKKLLTSLSNLKEKDYVVHNDYGVGIYRGLTEIEIEGVSGDFLVVEYADSKLYLPVQNIARIQKFAAAEGVVPALDKLSNPSKWLRTKERVRESVASLAGDLIRLYASRSVAKGWRYEPAGAEDERFAEDFPFNETPDQAKAIEDTLSDLSLDKPMDRLVCGDVGFGKTEVAIRAAFKAIQHARQVAVLVPTTILVEQHRRSFESRFRDYPVSIAGVNRFYSAKANTETLRKLAKGEIDIIIGTHRLLSKDVAFRDLGLLVIDEEHRFGVKQKEKLKALRKSVDVLTLTATPIPRTLHMSLLGIRDISVISTPPADRRVIRTYIANKDDHVIRDAILRELKRQGQVFYVFNRILGLAHLTHELSTLVPEAKFEFAHGQMKEHQLEKIMQKFLDRKVDVLVTTTIIESGLDIPNANTILIENAHALGLAQLYQLRGRVGRSERQAYSYFLMPKSGKLGADAQKRLKALQSLDDLGLGFSLALRDLEIRGAGNLLGKEQSGYVLSVGFDMYSRILNETVASLKGEELSLEETIDPEVKLLGSASIPHFYIPDVSERLILYQRLASIEIESEGDELEREIDDRFGPLPPEVSHYVELMKLRCALRKWGVLRAEQSESKIALSFSPKAPVDIDRINSLVKKHPDKFRFGKNLTLSIVADENTTTPPLVAALVKEVLSEIGQICL